MIDFLKRIKKTKLTKKQIVLFFLAATVLVMLVASEFSDSGTEISAVADTPEYSTQYIKKTEKELEALLSEINGAGKVEVMITLENCYENVYAKGYTTKSEQDDQSNKKEVDEEYIIVKNGSANEDCLVVKVYEPTVKGVAVVAQGADDIGVKTAITQTVCALFGISSAKVSVEKMTN